MLQIGRRLATLREGLSGVFVIHDGHAKDKDNIQPIINWTRNSAMTEGPRDALVSIEKTCSQ